MIVFTAIGLSIFWTLCYRLGHFLGWCTDSDGVLVAVARVLVGMDEVRISMTEVAAMLAAKEAEGAKRNG